MKVIFVINFFYADLSFLSNCGGGCIQNGSNSLQNLDFLLQLKLGSKLGFFSEMSFTLSYDRLRWWEIIFYYGG